MNEKEKVNRKFEQLQKLGEILTILESLNIDELESITVGSSLGKAVKLLKHVKENLTLTHLELEEEEKSVNHEIVTYESTVQSPKQSNKEQNHNKMVVDYLKKIFADTEAFPDRKSITDFFKKYFDIEYDYGKNSRASLVSRLCRILLEKDVSREEIGDALLKATNSKHGSLLQEKEPSFLKGWYEAIERM